MKNTVLVTGSNRGLGLEWVKQCCSRGYEVYATCRDPDNADALQQWAYGHENVHIMGLDITREDQAQAVARDLDGVDLNLLVNNAGVYHERWGKDAVGSIEYGDWEDTFRVNTLGAMRVCEALLPCLKRAKRGLAVAITSHMGSIAEIESPRDYAYRSSKAALNAAMVGLSHELKPFNIGVLLLHPGWVRTRMGGAHAPITTDVSVQGMLNLVEGFDMSQSGGFYRYNGASIPW